MALITFKPAGRGVSFPAPRLRLFTRRHLAVGPDGSPPPPGFAREVYDPYLVPRRLHWASGGRCSTLTVTCQLGSAPGRARLRPEEALNHVRIGDALRLEVAGQEWFRGHVGQVHPLIQANPDHEAFSLTAYGPEIRLQGKPVSGQWVKTVARDDAELSGTAAAAGATRAAVAFSDLPVIFNDAGQANATAAGFRLATAAGDPPAGDNKCKVFEAPGRRVLDDGGKVLVRAAHWTACTALRSLIEVVDDYDVISPETDWDEVERLIGGVVLGRVAAEGLNLLEAMRAVLLPAGFGFALTPWADATGRHRLEVFSLSEARSLRLPRLAPVAGGNVPVDSPAAQRAEVQRLDFVKDAHLVANQVRVVGDVRRKQVALEFNCHHLAAPALSDLHCFWDSSAHDLGDWAEGETIDPLAWTQEQAESFIARYSAAGSEFPAHRHVFRSFAWNEDGALSAVIAAVPLLSEFGLEDGEGNWVRRPRPVGRTFAYDEGKALARTFPAMVQLGIDGDEGAWITIPAAVWADRAGLSVTREHLHDWYPYRHAESQALRDGYGECSYLTLLHNAIGGGGSERLRLRLIGSVECDRAVSGEAPRRLESTWPFTAGRVIRADNRFKWRDVPSEADPIGADHDTADDSAAAADYARAVRDACETGMGHGSIVLRGLVRSVRPGQGVPHTAERRVDLAVHGGGEAAGGRTPVVVAVNWDFTEGVNKTEIVLDSPLLELAR